MYGNLHAEHCFVGPD
ncbi:unnamed protein product, partial [Rotaria sordida]